MFYYRTMRCFLLNIIFIIFLCSMFSGFSQAQTQKKADSLRTLLIHADDTTTIQLLIKIANLYYHEDTIKFRIFIQEAEAKAVDKHLLKYQGKCKQRFAYYLYNIKGEHITAIKYYQATIPLFEAAKNCELDIATSYYYLGYIYRTMGDYASTMKYALQILKLQQAQKDTRTMAQAYDLIGQVYYQQGNYQEALKNKEKSVALYKQTKSMRGLATALNNLATVYLGLKDYKKAIQINEEAMALYQETGDSLGMTYPIHNIGDTYLQMKDYKKAIPYFLLSMRVYAQGGSTLDAAMDYTKLGMCYVGLGQADKADFYVKQGLKMAIHNNETNSVIDSYQVLSGIDSIRGNFVGALKYYKKAVQLHDSLDTNEQAEQMNRMKTMYDVERSDAENLVLKKDSELKQKTIKQQYFIIFGAIVGFVLCVGLAVVLYRANKQSQKANRLLVTTQVLLLSQLIDYQIVMIN
jgi:tetratricopeptide (TPR) repeat protein